MLGINGAFGPRKEIACNRNIQHMAVMPDLVAVEQAAAPALQVRQADFSVVRVVVHRIVVPIAEAAVDLAPGAGREAEVVAEQPTLL